MATTSSGLAVTEALQKSLVEKKYVGHMPKIVSQYSTGLKLGDTAIVPLVKAGAAADFHATNNNYVGSGASGSITGVNVLLNKQKFVALKIPAYIKDRVQVQSAVDSAVRQLALAIAGDIFGGMVAATYTNTAKVIGDSSLTYAEFVALKDEIVAQSMNPTATTAALLSAYISSVEADPAVYNDMAYRAAVAGGNQTSALISRIAGIGTVRTAQIPAGTKVVGALFDDTAVAIAMGNNAPFASDTNVAYYSEVADPDTGFNLAVSEVYDPATRAMVLGVEAVYGVKEGDVSKLTLLTSARGE